ncbi:MAG TPA: DUF1549 and DUF1553 domain-containing protein [Gemmatales bacterium]|nr:DUF1549 and DUF1553 domain-containing protein [Gemmatales bacterium]
MVITCAGLFALTLGAAALTFDDQTKPDARTWWAIQPLAKPVIPTVSQSKSCKNPIDQFILASLEQAKMQPSIAADKRTLLRRVTVDLTGLLPTPEELANFEKDTSPTAYEKVVDRLLASPRFGERMARHWLDLVHYAESHGHDEDKHRPHAWPYRDYLIRSFNSDKPYSRFVQEQVAGDVLFPYEPDGMVALGMLAAGPWDQSSQLGIMDGTLDKQIARYLDRDDMLTTVMSTFTSTTVHCARCHDHKFDPINMDDYYALQAVFAGVDRINRDYDETPQTARKREQLSRELKLWESTKLDDPRWSTPEAETTAKVWEANQTKWTMMEPLEARSFGGAQLEILDDLSIRSGGARPDIDTVIITGNTTLKRITALRLELLTDPALPYHGPGRHDNGNLHLSEIGLKLVSREHPEKSCEVKITQASSDYDQPDWGVAKAIDHNAKTAWGIFPQVGKPHVAVFELSEPCKCSVGDELHVALEQKHGAGHLLGRFRVSVTSAKTPEKATPRTNELSLALAIPAAQRSMEQKRIIARHARLVQIKQDLSELPPVSKVYAVGCDFPADGNFKPPMGPRKVDVLRRGDIKQPMRAAQPGSLSCITTVPARFILKNANNEGQRRAALAHWLTDKNNTLTWRSMANRLWQCHFGRGLVETANDFGKMGSTPTHPELLDWLAIQLRDGKSLKAMHRLIVTSATYQQASTVNALTLKSDPENKLYSRMDHTRLDAETIRDAMLQVAAKLDLTMYGPSVKHFNEKPGPHVTMVADYDHFNLDSPGTYRRSIYRFVFRTVPDPLLDVLDCPDGSQWTAKRSESTTPLQALALLHHPLSIRLSEHLAARVSKDAREPDQQIALIFQLLYQRTPNDTEKKTITNYLHKHGLANTCRLLLNTNEFHYID